jgi:hypothetical protein
MAVLKGRAFETACAVRLRIMSRREMMMPNDASYRRSALCAGQPACVVSSGGGLYRAGPVRPHAYASARPFRARFEQ